MVSLVLTAVVVAVTGAWTAGVVSSRGPSCRGSALTVTIVASPDQQTVLAMLAQRFNQTKPRADKRCVNVEVDSAESAATTAALGSGWDPKTDGPRPDVWAPDSSVWTRLVRANPRAAALVPDGGPSLASTPVVMALPRPMAEALGWAGRQPRWQAIVERLQDPTGWASVHHPEWGPMKIGMTDPAADTAGLSAMLSLVTGEAGDQPAGRELDDVLLLSHAIASAGTSSAALYQHLQQADQNGTALAYLSAFPSTERDVAQYNAADPRVPLTAVYPQQGAPDADHPYVVLSAPWVGSVKKAAAAQFLAFLRTRASVTEYEKVQFRPADRGKTRWLAGAGIRPVVSSPDRAVQTPDVVVKLIGLWTAMHQVGNTLAVIDGSGSLAQLVAGTGKTKLQLLQAAALRSVGIWRAQSIVGLWSFARRPGANDVQKLAPMAPMGAADSAQRKAVNTAILQLTTAGSTPLYDVALAAYQHVQRNWKTGYINIVAFLTDGRNEVNGGLTLDGLVAKLKAARDPNRPIFFVAIAYGADADVRALRAITSTVGGRTFVASRPTDIDQVFAAALIGALSSARTS